MKNISINLFRISSDSKYLDIIIQAPADYVFKQFNLEVRFIKNSNFTSIYFNLSDVLIKNESINKLMYRIPLSSLNEIDVNAIFIGSFVTINPETFEEIEDTAYCSNVNNIYLEILDDIMNLKNECSNISDDTIRNYLLLYGHESAMAQGDMDTALEYYKILINHFNKCGTLNRHCSTGCGSKHIVKSSCGCEK